MGQRAEMSPEGGPPVTLRPTPDGIDRITQLPSGTVTFLFTDIEGSTRLAEDLGDKYQAVLEAHHRLVREGLGARGGIEVSTEGDSFFCVFANARSAIETAAALQKTIWATDWPADAVVRVRMGIHTGEGTLGADNYVGADVHRAARISAAAHGGQVLISGATRALTESYLGPELALRDLGLHGLRDLSHPEQLHQLLIDGLPTDFPAPRTLDARPGNLPTQLTSFVGRHRELAETEEVVGRSRLVTLIGEGGSGKTRLALESSARLLDYFPDGVWFIDLAPLTDAAFLEEEVAVTLGIQQQTGRELVDTILDVLCNKTALLVLDNCEHLVESAATFVDSVLSQAPDVRVMATSRGPIGASGEVTLRVPPLGLPQANKDGDSTVSDPSDAVRLFVERGQSADPSFQLNSENVEAIAHICVRVDGLPLAIELAAARLRVFSPSEIAARLDDRFRLLTGGARTALPRQHTLQAAVDWSYEMLSAVEQQLFDRLSVFSGGFTMGAAEDVCSEASIDVVDNVIRLVDQSMVVAEPGLDGGTRYRLLETLRHYGRQRLQERGEEAEFRARHVGFVSRIAEEALPHLNGRQHRRWMQRLDAEHENCRVALDWCRDTREVRDHLNLVALWGYFWTRFGLWTEARTRLNEALDLEDDKHPELRLRAILSTAEVFVAVDRERVATLANEALDLADRHGDSGARVDARYLGGYSALHSNDHERAVNLLEQALELCEQDGLESERARLLVMMGNAFSDRDTARARSYLETGLSLHREAANLSGVAQSLHYLGALAVKSGDLDTAAAWLEEGLEVDAEIGGRDNSGHLLMELGSVRRLQGDSAEAHTLLSEALAFLTNVGDQNCVARTRTRLGLLAVSEGSLHAAREHLKAGLLASAGIGDGNVVIALEGLAATAVAAGDAEHAVVLLAAADGMRIRRDLRTPAPELDQREREIDSLRQRLGPVEFEKAWERGSEMSFDDAVTAATKA